MITKNQKITEAEYKKGLEVIEAKFEREKKEWAIKVAEKNNPVKIGDFVTDGTRTIKVYKITYTRFLSGLPKCYYLGVEYKKDNTEARHYDTGELVYSQISQSACV